MALLVVIALSIINVFGVKTGAIIQNVFTFAKVAALLGLMLLGSCEGRNAVAVAANFGANFWHNAGLGALHPVQVGVGGPIVLVGTLTILSRGAGRIVVFGRCVEQRNVHCGRGHQSQANLPLSLAIGTAAVIALYIGCNVVYLNVLPLAGSPDGTTVLARGIQHATEDRVATAALSQMFGSLGAILDGGSYPYFERRMQ